MDGEPIASANLQLRRYASQRPGLLATSVLRNALSHSGGKAQRVSLARALAIDIAAPDAGGLRATVECVAQGPGRWEIALAGGERLHSHLPSGIRINPQRTVVISAER